MTGKWLDQVAWSPDGLVPALAQDYLSGRILMMAWVNRQALELAVKENRAVYWSRSRNEVWRKGEQSGHTQKLHGVFLDCDNDCICYQVEQEGGIACHTGRESCFYQRLEGQDWITVDPVIKDPGSIYG